jgi:16S rRNA (adenine1518-N6/adenine1519-N6)-dimethyltransferase
MKFKKHLGQHFLKNQSVAGKIVKTANISKNDIILEVGPGHGSLTELLIQRAKHIIAVEKDKELVDFLSDKFKGQKKLSVIHGDILKFNPKSHKLKSTRYKVVANIPYYITSRFLRQFLESDNQPSLMVLMLQKEVAERIAARNYKESLLSISVKAYGQPKIIAKVPAGNFFPAPKVDSAIIAIENISKDFFSAKGSPARNVVSGGIDEKDFFKMLKLGFSHKRKLLKNNLKISDETLQKCEIPALSRPENLSLNNWKCLYKNL